MKRFFAITALCGFPFAAMAGQHPAIIAFTSYCFKAYQTPDQARASMESLVGAPLPFELTFWDVTRAPAPDAPDVIERRCEVAWDGAHTDAALTALRAKMAEPPVFGLKIDLPKTHSPTPGTALLEGRELLRGRVAVVHVGTRTKEGAIQTFISVDRLPADWQSKVPA